MMSLSIRCTSLLIGWVLLTGATPEEAHHHAATQAIPEARYSRSVASFQVPKVDLINSAGETISLPSLLAKEEPVVMQFIFTTCPAVCPVLTSTLATARRQLDDETAAGDTAADAAVAGETGRVQALSITIDPEYDTPEQLRRYRERFDADAQWLFLTGSLQDIVTVQKAFNTYRGNKMRHEPVTLLRGSPTTPWVRLEGFPSAQQLAEEIQRLLD